MTSSAPTRVLVVAHRTAATPRLLAEVRARARRSPCSFTLLVPRPYWDPDTEQAADTLELAIPLLDEAAGGHVEGIVGDSDPFAAVEQARGRRIRRDHHLHTSGARVALAAPRPPPSRRGARPTSQAGHRQAIRARRLQRSLSRRRDLTPGLPHGQRALHPALPVARHRAVEVVLPRPELGTHGRPAALADGLALLLARGVVQPPEPSEPTP